MRPLIIKLPVQPLSDEELVARYRAERGPGEARCWLDELFERHYRRVAVWCLRITGDRASAADLAQDVLLKAYRHIDSFQGNSKFSTWLYTIARNHCFNEIRARRAEPLETLDAELVEFADRSASPEAAAQKASDVRFVRELISQSLDEVETQVFTLHYAEEVPLDAITRLLKLNNASGAKAYIVSARRKLARAVERWKDRQPRAK